jgi:hypothetical protein
MIAANVQDVNHATVQFAKMIVANVQDVNHAVEEVV